MGVGVGEWRPERNGEFGTYKVGTDIQVIHTLDPKYSIDAADYEVYDDDPEEDLTPEDFAELDAPPELVAEPEPEDAKAKAEALAESLADGRREER